jgi:hypothetical protein
MTSPIRRGRLSAPRSLPCGWPGAVLESAVAHDHSPPRVVLGTGGEGKPGRAYRYEWVERQGDDTCAQLHVDGIPRVRKGFPWRPKSRIHIRFWKRQRPRRLSIHAYHRLDSNGFPSGRARRLRPRLRKREWDGGGHIWIATFRGPKVAHLYLDVFAKWRDQEDCGGAQTMAFVWHLRARSP